MSDEKEWPREIWAAEMLDYEPLGTYALSEHATVARHEGDTERDRQFHHYIDADIYESAEKYWRARLKSALSAARDPVEELENRILAHMVAENACKGEICLTFKGFEPLGLHVEVLRGLLKSLKARDLVRHYINLICDDGTFAGAGYSLASAGIAQAERLQEADNG